MTRNPFSFAHIALAVVLIALFAIELTATSQELLPYITSLEFNNQGNKLAVAYGDINDPCGNFHNDPNLIGVFMLDLQKTQDLIFNDCTVINLAFSPTDQVLASVSIIGRAIKYDLNEQKILTIGDLAGRPYIDNNWVDNIFTNVTQTGVQITDTNTNENKTLLPQQWLSASDLNTLGQIVTSGEDGTIIIWDSINLLPELSFTQHETRVSSVKWNPNNTIIASGDDEGVLKIWNSVSGDSHLSFGAHASPIRGLAWSPDGTRLVSASEDGKVKIWDAENGILLETLTYSGPVYALDWSPDGQKLAYGGADISGNSPEIEIIDTPVINEPPVANAGADQNVVDTNNSGSESLTLHGEASSDIDGSIVSYLWTEVIAGDVTQLVRMFHLTGVMNKCRSEQQLIVISYQVSNSNH